MREQIQISIIRIGQEIDDGSVHFIVVAVSLQLGTDIDQSVNVLAGRRKCSVRAAEDVRKSIAVDVQLKLGHVICIAIDKLDLMFKPFFITEPGEKIIKDLILFL